MKGIQSIADSLNQASPRLSFEVFPPRTESGLAALYETVGALAESDPHYVSVTYGAGGSTKGRTLEVAKGIQESFGLTAMHHLTLVNQTRDELVEVIGQIRNAGIRNVLALRGDPPKEMGETFRTVPGGLEFCYELLDLIREEVGDYFSLGVAGFPEGHPDCPSKTLDTAYLKKKIDHGAQFVVTQFFFENEIYSEYLERTARAGIDVPIIPGVLPVVDYDKLLDFSSRCGAYICDLVHETFAPLRDQPDSLLKVGRDYAVQQCEDLLRRGAPGIHLYSLNRLQPTRDVMERLGATVAG